MARRAIHITRKPNCATTHIDHPIIHMDCSADSSQSRENFQFPKDFRELRRSVPVARWYE
jgi:hypothetical protein